MPYGNTIFRKSHSLVLIRKHMEGPKSSSRYQPKHKVSRNGRSHYLDRIKYKSLTRTPLRCVLDEDILELSAPGLSCSVDEMDGVRELERSESSLCLRGSSSDWWRSTTSRLGGVSSCTSSMEGDLVLLRGSRSG